MPSDQERGHVGPVREAEAAVARRPGGAGGAGGVTQLPKRLTDKEIAAEIKAEITARMAPVLEIFAEASRNGMMVMWDGIGVDALGRFQMNNLRIVKLL